MKVIPEMRRAH